MPADPRNLCRLEVIPKSIRNICILAHIDHGKTSLSDCLLASNGIISQSHQGEIRYLDSRPDEQERGITMEASAISLYFRTVEQEYVVNLIDSPGHVDFSSEVTQASRLCDGSIILVDALEGVCSQTVNALKQAWDEELQSILVINKIDKLFYEWQLSSAEAATHLEKVVEQVNAVWGQFYVGKRMATEQDNDDILYFEPANNNVVFASAIQGFGFTIHQFASIYEKKLGVEKAKLSKFLWGNYYLDPKTKRVVKGVNSKRKPLFQQFIMDNIWAIYEAYQFYDTDKISKISSALNLKNTDPHDIRTIFNQWIPVSRAIISSLISLPSPDLAQKKRIHVLLDNTPNVELIDESIKPAIIEADLEGPQLAYVAKVVSVSSSQLPSSIDSVNDRLSSLRMQNSAREEVDDNVVLGFARIFSGVFEKGMYLNLLGPRYDPAEPDKYIHQIQISAMYLFMGRDLIPVEKAGPGAIVGIAGLDGKIIKSGTLVQPGVIGPNLARSARVATPILRVAVEPQDPTKLDELEQGLEMLNISDPSVEFEISDLGEFILATSGELHLERCLHDLELKFAKVPIDVSLPIVPFRETIVSPCEDGCDNASVDVGGYRLKLSVSPIKVKEVKDLPQSDTPLNSEDEIDNVVIIDQTNRLIDETPDNVIINNKFGSQSIINGFKAAISKGPLIGEPTQNVQVSILEFSYDPDLVNDKSTNVIAQRRLISATHRLIHQIMEKWSPRIMLAMYLCEIQASTDVLGKLYGVITKRRGKVLTEELKEGTPFFQIQAQIPVVESMGFSEEIRKKTSGAANPQLMFSGYQMLDEDPFWVPSTEEEIEDLGEIADRENLALIYVNQTRKRKGLTVNEKLVENAERDRTHRH